jgi:hypothetical protein
MTFNADGYPTSETRASGTADQQSITYDRQAGTGLLNGVTDGPPVRAIARDRSEPHLPG